MENDGNGQDLEWTRAVEWSSKLLATNSPSLDLNQRNNQGTTTTTASTTISTTISTTHSTTTTTASTNDPAATATMICCFPRELRLLFHRQIFV